MCSKFRAEWCMVPVRDYLYVLIRDTRATGKYSHLHDLPALPYKTSQDIREICSYKGTVAPRPAVRMVYFVGSVRHLEDFIVRTALIRRSS